MPKRPHEHKDSSEGVGERYGMSLRTSSMAEVVHKRKPSSGFRAYFLVCIHGWLVLVIDRIEWDVIGDFAQEGKSL